MSLPSVSTARIPLRSILDQRGISQERLALQSGVSEHTLSKIINRKTPSICGDTARMIALALNTTVSAIGWHGVRVEGATIKGVLPGHRTTPRPTRPQQICPTCNTAMSNSNVCYYCQL